MHQLWGIMPTDLRCWYLLYTVLYIYCTHNLLVAKPAKGHQFNPYLLDLAALQFYGKRGC
jgi:hypothetical protein